MAFGTLAAALPTHRIQHSICHRNISHADMCIWNGSEFRLPPVHVQAFCKNKFPFRFTFFSFATKFSVEINARIELVGRT